MPRAKKSTTRSTSKKAPSVALNKAYESELSYETRVIITILLLLFVYPVGIIFMWAWMHSWPVWLKLIITLPLLLGIFAFFSAVFLIGSILSHAHVERGFHEQMQQHQMQISPTTFPTLPTSLTPAPITY